MFQTVLRILPLEYLSAVRLRGADALISTFRSLGEGRETEVALHRLPHITPVGDIEVFAHDR